MSQQKAIHIATLHDFPLDVPDCWLRVERRFWENGTSCLHVYKRGRRKSDGIITGWSQPQYTQLPWECAGAFHERLAALIGEGNRLGQPLKLPFTFHLGGFALDLPNCFLRIEKEYKRDGTPWLWVTKWGPRPSDGVVTAWNPSQYSMIPWHLAEPFAACLPGLIEEGARVELPTQAVRRLRIPA